MKLGKSIYNEEGLVLLGEGVELTDQLLRRLEQSGVDYLYIRDERTDDIKIPEPLSEETRRETLRQVRYHFRRIMDSSVRKRGSNSYLGKDFRRIMNMMIDDLWGHHDAMMMLTRINLSDFYLYEHSVNVCTYALILGMASGFNREQITELGLGALLHDIGKTKIPGEILQKPGKLTEDEMEIVKEHTTAGYYLLKDEPNIPLVSAHCAFQHHERLNGSGYPRGLKEEEIHEYAQWIGIVDAFDAMTTNRVYRGSMLPHQALDILFAGSGTLFDTGKLESFRDRIALYPLGISVTLNTGERGVVVDINSSSPHRPVVRILQDAEGRELTQPYEIDLSKKLAVMVAEVNA